MVIMAVCTLFVVGIQEVPVRSMESEGQELSGVLSKVKRRSVAFELLSVKDFFSQGQKAGTLLCSPCLLRAQIWLRSRVLESNLRLVIEKGR